MNKIIVDLERVELSQTTIWQSKKAVMDCLIVMHRLHYRSLLKRRKSKTM